MWLRREDGAVEISTGADGVVRVVAMGVISPATVMSAVEIAWSARRHKHSPNRYQALLVDISAIMLTEADAIVASRLEPVTMNRTVPCALVVPPRRLPLALDYCMRSAMQGVIIGAFTAVDIATDWVQARGLALQQQRELCQTIELGTPLRRRVGDAQGLLFDPATWPGQEPLGWGALQ